MPRCVHFLTTKKEKKTMKTKIVGFGATVLAVVVGMWAYNKMKNKNVAQ